MPDILSDQPITITKNTKKVQHNYIYRVSFVCVFQNNASTSHYLVHKNLPFILSELLSTCFTEATDLFLQAC